MDMTAVALAQENNIPVDETPFTMEDLKNADEVFISSATQLCRRAGSLNGENIGCKDSKLAELIQNCYWDKYMEETK